MAYGFEVINSSGHTVIDSTYSCLHSGTAATSNYSSSQTFVYNTSSTTTAYIHNISCQKDDFVFVSIGNAEWCSGGFYASGVKTFYSSETSFSYFIAKRPTNASGYGLATYDASGNLLYSANENLTSIKDVAKLTQTSPSFTKSAGANYFCPTPARFYLNFGSVYGVTYRCLQGTATSQMTVFEPRNPVYVFPPNIFGATGNPDLYVLSAKYA